MTFNSSSTIAFERATDVGSDRYSLPLAPRAWTLTKLEVKTGGVVTPRSTYTFEKSET